MDIPSNFHTLKGYQLIDKPKLTASMEDYLEMIYRLLKTQPHVRIKLLAKKLNVRPPSASKMVHQLKNMELVDFEKYGNIKPTQKGLMLGNYFLYRHDVLMEFLCLVNNTSDELEQVEKIEHFVEERTVYNLDKCINVLKSIKKD